MEAIVQEPFISREECTVNVSHVRDAWGLQHREKIRRDMRKKSTLSAEEIKEQA